MSVFTLPSELNFDYWAFWDPGANLTAQYLIRHGYRITTDIPYHYGLLPLLVGDAWFRAMSLTPAACLALSKVSEVFMVWGLFRFASALRLGLAGWTLLVVATPFAIRPDYPNLAHVFEAALLCNAIAEHAAGRRAAALALATAAVFAKPSMGFVYGALLLIFIFREHKVRGGGALDWCSWLRSHLPAAAAGAIIAVVCAAVYGVGPLLNTIFPLVGAKAYQASGYGLIGGVGKYLFYFPGVHWGYYLGTVVLFWLLATVWVVAVCIGAIGWGKKFHTGIITVAPVGELVFACVLMHLTFLACFYGSAASWMYYSYILVMGLVATTLWPWVPRYAIWAIAMVALLGQKELVTQNYRRWHTESADKESAGLWMAPDERREWNHARALAGNTGTAVLDMLGGVELLFPQFEKPVTLYFAPGLFTPTDATRKAAQLATARTVVMPVMVPLYRNFVAPEAVRRALARFDLEWRGRFFAVYATRGGRSTANAAIITLGAAVDPRTTAPPAVH